MIRAKISGKKTEVHSAVLAKLLKTRMSCKRMTARVFKYKHSLLVQDICTKYKVRQLSQTRVVIGWICKNYIKGLNWFPHVPECIGPKHSKLVQLHGSAGFLNKFKMQGSHFNGSYGACSPGGKFIAYAACTGKKIQYIQFFHAVLVNQNVK